MKKWIVGAVMVAMLILSGVFLHSSGLVQFKPIELSASSFPQLQTLALNRKGNLLFLAQNFKGAFESYVTALQYDPFSAGLHLNIGLTYEAEQQSEKAISSYQNAFNYSQDGLIQFMALFNQAQLHGKAKKYEEALKAYQQALKLNPASKEVKTNIELLIQAQQQEQKQDDKNQDGDKKDDKPNDSKDENKDSQDGKSPKDGKKDDKKDDKNKDPKDDKNKDQKKDEPKPEDKKDEKKPEEKPSDKDNKDDKEKQQDQPKTPAKNEKYKPRPFDGKELSEADVKKILGEIKQQEQKIRSEFNRKDVKEQPRDKDW
jgi:Ca-activated chloride channel family protein